MKHLVLAAFLSLLSSGSICADSLIDAAYELFGLGSVENAGTTSFPILEIPSGGRLESMGGAYTAVADRDAFTDGNPAVTSSRPGGSYGVTHKDWIADSSIETIHVTRSSRSVGFGISAKYLRIPFTAYDDVGKRSSSGHFSEAIVTANLSVTFIDLPRIAVAAGTNVKGIFRLVSDTIVESQSAYSLPLDIGFLARFRLLAFGRRDVAEADPLNLSFGVALRNAGQSVVRLHAKLPTVISAGIAYSPVPGLLLSGDFTLPISFDVDDPPESPYGAAGLSIAVTRFLDLQAGVRIRDGDHRASLGSVAHIGPISIATTYMVGYVSGFSPDGSLSASITIKTP